MSGPAKTPTAILEKRGSWKINERKDEPTPQGMSKLPPKSKHLKGEAAKFHKKAGASLLNMGVLSQADYHAFILMCEEYQQYKEADALCGELIITTTNGNIIQNPAVGIRNKSRDALKKSMSYFGMTPSSRPNITAINDDTASSDNRERFFKVG